MEEGGLHTATDGTKALLGPRDGYVRINRWKRDRVTSAGRYITRDGPRRTKGVVHGIC